MTTETKEITGQSSQPSDRQITNEQIAVALGWTQSSIKAKTDRYRTTYWLDTCGILICDIRQTPDFTHDLNASWKYVWPTIVRIRAGEDFDFNFILQRDAEYFKNILWEAYKSPNPAMYLATKLMELKSATP